MLAFLLPDSSHVRLFDGPEAAAQISEDATREMAIAAACDDSSEKEKGSENIIEEVKRK